MVQLASHDRIREAARRVVWAPQSGSQYSALTCPAHELLYHGTRGPGKTDALLMQYAQHVGCGLGEAWFGVIFRRTYKQLKDIIRKSHRWFRQIFPEARWNGSEFEWRWPDGETLLFRYMDDPKDYWNYHGWEIPFLGWEELTNWPTPECYLSMFSTNRTSIPGVPLMIRGTANPWGVGHNWVKRRFPDFCRPGVIAEDPETGITRAHIWGHWSENKALLRVQPNYPRNIMAAASSPAQAKAWLGGSWDVVAGGMFDDLWTRRIHAVRPFDIPKGWRIDRAGDWGESKPFSIGWYAENTEDRFACPTLPGHVCPKGSLFRIGEWYGWDGKNPNVGIRMSATDVGRGIVEREKALGIRERVRPGPFDSAAFTLAEDGVSIAAKMAKAGAEFLEAQKGPGSRKLRWRIMRDMLEAAQRNDIERPHLHVFDGRCSQWERTVPVAPRDLDKDPDDIDTEAEDHTADETGYRVLKAKRGLKAGAFSV